MQYVDVNHYFPTLLMACLWHKASTANAHKQTDYTETRNIHLYHLCTRNFQSICASKRHFACDNNIKSRGCGHAVINLLGKRSYDCAMLNVELVNAFADIASIQR